MSLKDFYFKIEDKYYGFIDWLDKKGFPSYKFVDFFESKNVPSFPVFVLLLLSVVGTIGFFAYSFLMAPYGLITLVVQDEEGNPLSGVSVSVKAEGLKAVEDVTNDDGELTLLLPLNKDLTITLMKRGFEPKEKTFSFKTAKKEVIILSAEIKTISKTIHLLNEETLELLSDYITIEFTCSNPSSDFFESKSTANGVIELDVPSDCGFLLATPQGNYVVTDGTIDLEDPSPALYLSEEKSENGQIEVYLTDELGNPVSGILVSVVLYPDTEIDSSYSTSAGSVFFSEIPTGRYYVVAYDPQGRFKTLDSSTQNKIEDVLPNETTQFNLQLEKTTAGKITVYVTDKETHEAIENAEVRLIQNGVTLTTNRTDADGKTEFTVEEDTLYDLEINHRNYIIEQLKDVSVGSTVNVELEFATEANTQTLSVFVVDPTNKPVELARVTLKKTDGTTVGASKLTGADGRVEFENLPEGNYYVYVVKNGFEGKNSETVSIKPREKPAELKVVLNIGSGTVKVSVFDEEMQPIQGANVKAIDLFDESTLEEGMTDLDGVKSFTIRADKKVFFIVEHEGFLAYYSTTVFVAPDVTIEKQFILPKDVSQLEVEFLGLFVDDEIAASSLGIGQKYTAKLQLKIPKGTTFNEAGIHLRTGASENNKSNIMEEDNLFIRDVFAQTSKILKSTSYTPPDGYGNDSSHLTTGNAKWVNIIWKNPSAGVYNVEAEIVVKDSAKLGELLQIWYRGWGKSGGSITRFPVDSVLKNAESVPEKQALYANAKLVQLSVGPTNLCNIGFCKQFFIEDLQKNIVSAVVDNYPAGISNNYKLNFRISSTSEKLYSDVTIEIDSGSSGLLFKDYKFVTPLGQEKGGKANAYEFGEELGDVSKDSVVTGEVYFLTEKEGINKLNIKLKSGKEQIFVKSINIVVRPAKELVIDILPKEIIPLIDNMVLVKVSDSNAHVVSGAAVTIFLNDERIANGITDGQGIFPVKVETPNIGSTLKIVVYKNGYRKAVREIVIDSEILTITPSKAYLRLNINSNDPETTALLVENLTTIPLKIQDLEFSREIQELIEVRFEEDYVGRVIDANADSNMFFRTRLSPEGLLIEKPTTVEGVLSIYLTNDDFKRSWVQNLPVALKIVLDGELDDVDCLIVSPAEVGIFTGKKKKQVELVLTNNCKAKNKPVNLKNLQAKVDWGNRNSLGTLTLSSSDIENSSTIELGAKFKKLAPTLEDGFEGMLLLEFDPKEKIVSAEANPSLVIKAVNYTENGEEEIKTKVKLNIVVNDLLECLKVKAPPEIVLINVPGNLGYSVFPRYGYYPGMIGGGYGYGSYYSGYGNTQGYRDVGPYRQPWGAAPYSYGYGYGSYPYTSYPYQGYNAPFYSNYYQDPNYSYSFQYGEGTFRIENNCKADVEVKLDADSAVSIKESLFVIEPNAETKVELEPGYRIGKFKIEVKAKVKDSDEKPTLIEELFVTVRPIYDIWDVGQDCIKISPSGKIKLTDFVGKPFKVTVYNNCYDLGVRLQETDETLEFICSIPEEVMGGGSDKCPLISQVYYVDESRQPGPNNKTIQKMRFEVKPDVRYRDIAIKLGEKKHHYQQLGDLRIYIQEAYYRVEARTNVRVSYIDQFGRRDKKTFFLILEDWWGALGPAAGLSEWGSPDITNFMDCINKDALNVAKYYSNMFPSTLGFIPEYEFSGKEKAIFVFPSSKRLTNEKVMLIGPDKCGSLDKLSGVRPEKVVDEKTGLGLSFKIFDDSHDIQLTLDRSQMSVACAALRVPVMSDLTRSTYNIGTQRVGLDAVVYVLHKDIDKDDVDLQECIEKGFVPLEKVETIEPIGEKGFKACEKGTTGEGVFNLYGFDKLLFDWQFDLDKGMYVCDEIDGQFDAVCDATQFSITLNHKVKKIKDFIKNNGEFNENEENVKKGVCAGQESCANELKNSKEFFRWVKKQVLVKDRQADGTIKELVFFLGKNDLILEFKEKANAVESSALDSLNALFKAGITGDNYNKWVEDTQTLLRDISTDKELSSDIVAEISKDAFESDEFKNTLEKIGGEIPQTYGKEYEKYVMTFNEYKTFHDKLMEKTKTNTEAKDVNINIFGEEVEINYLFVKAIANNIVFKVGIRNKLQISEEEKEKVIEDSAELDGLKLDESFKAFYYNNVEFVSYLMADGFSEDFKNDFEKVYGNETEFDERFNEWVFEVKNKRVAAGRHPIKINHNWNSEKTVIEFGKMLSLEQVSSSTGKKYSSNVFFWLPFDGQLGVDDGRDGYGIGFNNLKDKIIFVTFKSPSATEKNIKFAKDMDSLKSYDLVYGESFNDTKTGTILRIAGQEFAYSPSVPVFLDLTITKNPSGLEGILYDLHENGKKTSSFIVWTDDESISDKQVSKAEGQQLCKEVGQPHYGFVKEFSGSGRFDKTIAYLPAFKQHSLRLVCAKQSAKLGVEQYNLENNKSIPQHSVEKTITGFRGGEGLMVKLNERQDDSEFNLQKVVEGIKNERVCVSKKKSSSEIELIWNPALKG